MEKTAKIYTGLIVLTVLSIVAAYYVNYVTVIMILAALKFIGVSFYFMELKKAHIFWKVSLLVFLILFVVLILFLFEQ
ncbi:cytochrome C oxidase subunit IV family protein [Maribacter sp. HTCC2170]|uniref:cytochrome C oxidase subunit IV family protein n=1 Tax=Maribacter sp. (strain HTCC2170 / KCCM 42371) TaxID=313603 RepID=UPI00006B4791|nr:cytochrome C oxidase subunit IV family protein [Maribacter sp. HTCC2170]EAR01823.1 hypothetical protein FB2170_14883 [Maribacter sp. HTCC2170]